MHKTQHMQGNICVMCKQVRHIFEVEKKTAKLREFDVKYMSINAMSTKLLKIIRILKCRQAGKQASK